MSKLLTIINNVSSVTVLECTQGHIIRLEALESASIASISYKKGERHPRNCIFLRAGKWKIAAKKYQNK